jgi:signal transduction histidine kinase/PAS domain-containing protein
VNRGDLTRQFQAAHERVEDLLQCLNADLPQQTALSQRLTELAATLSELEQTTASVLQQNKALIDGCQKTIAQGQQYQELFDGAPGSYLVTDSAGMIQAANQAAAALLNRSPQSLVGESIAAFMAAESVPAFERLLLQIQQSPAPLTAEISLKLPDANPLHAILSGMASSGASQSPTALRWLLHDITKRKQAEMVLQQRVEREQLIGAVAQRIRQSLNPQEILNNAVAEVRQFLQADRVVVYQLEATKSATVVAEAVEPEWRSILGFTSNPRLTAERLAFYSHSGYQAIADVQQAPYSAELVKLLLQQQVKAVLVVPIVHETELLGLICAHQCSSLRDWQSTEVDLLRQLADQVAIALQQSKLYQQAQQLNADLEQQVQNRTEQVQQALKFESMLKRITDKVRDSLDESQILQAAVQELTLVLGLSGCNAALYDLDQGISTIRYDYANSIPTSQGRVAQMDHFPEIYSQLQQGLYFQFCSLIPNPVRGRVSMLACPIFVDLNSSQGIDQAVLGDLWLINHKDYVFNEFEIRLVQQVANQCAIAIRQARLFQAAQAQVQELEKLNRLKDEFLSTVSHELRTPISNVKMAIHMLKTAPTEERRQRYLEILETESTREAELIDDLLDLQRLEVASCPIHLETLPLQKWLPDLVQPFRSRITHHNQTLRVEYSTDLLPIKSDFSILRRILAELLNNACKYTAGGHQITLSVQQHADSIGSVTIFTLSNQANIPHSELPNIFEKFYRVPNADPWKQGGTGLGLALVQKLVERLYGTIAVESQNGWTTFTVCLPTQINEE